MAYAYHLSPWFLPTTCKAEQAQGLTRGAMRVACIKCPYLLCSHRGSPSFIHALIVLTQRRWHDISTMLFSFPLLCVAIFLLFLSLGCAMIRSRLPMRTERRWLEKGICLCSVNVNVSFNIFSYSCYMSMTITSISFISSYAIHDTNDTR